ncbi:type II toxin-antitoxin system VapB family antitoxin [Ottowia testudinis]|uniref:Type II toxin-antitoxin system VapB family antitoxin n=1 Tax=Ottowia testudinis TaxID=2816950 RepID=A0A975CGB8_9BURK|nr:type II toxin-antitoxin system VapB family antitoxin [Ottowia testudinis]QTD45923.1 type II toxin-antitoxin system VapB family antitoxin [Ottowia testudinis]
MRTNIFIDEEVMAAAMKGGQFKTKREAVEAGLRLLARRNHAREVLKWRGKLHWDDQPDPAAVAAQQHAQHVAEPQALYQSGASAAGKKAAGAGG